MVIHSVVARGYLECRTSHDRNFVHIVELGEDNLPA